MHIWAAENSDIENRNSTAQKINRVISLNILWKCKLRLGGEYGVFEPEFGRSWEVSILDYQSESSWNETGMRHLPHGTESE